MTTAATSTPTLAEPTTATDPTTVAPLGGITRDIARGGLAAILVGLVGCGLGSRLVMRLAALLVPGAAGSTTENGNRIGTITLDGSLFLVVAGLFIGLLGGVIWVAISPWIPGTGLRRAGLAAFIGIGLGAAGLVDGANSDFTLLRHDPRVVASLIGLVGLIGFGFAVVDGWLERRLPPVSAERTRSASIYELLSLLGVLVILPFTVFVYAASENRATVIQGILLGAVAIVTLIWWAGRLRGRPDRSSRQIAGRTPRAGRSRSDTATPRSSRTSSRRWARDVTDGSPGSSRHHGEIGLVDEPGAFEETFGVSFGPGGQRCSVTR